MVTREVTRVLQVAQAQELRSTPGQLWPSLQAKHSAEISAVRDGDLTIVDRRTGAYPMIPESLHRLNQPIVKNTPVNLRRFSETPVPRRAINLIKNAIVSLPWKIVPIEDIENDGDTEKRSRIATRNLKRPNNSDSWKTLLEQVTEDILIGGYGAIEPRLTPHFERPFKLWAIDGSTLRIFGDWRESEPDKPHYAQMTGMRGERSYIELRDDEVIYIRDNVRSNTPFGLGKLEVCFNVINAFLGTQDMASKAGSDPVFKTWLWWTTSIGRGQLETVDRHVRNEAEGQSKLSLISGMPKPEVIEVEGVTNDQLLIPWQEFCIRIMAQGFDLSPMALGLERDVNRNTGEIMAAADFKSAVLPVARKIEEAITRYLFNRLLDWKDLEFKFVGLEDPDLITKITAFQRLYTMDGITSSEIREDLGRTKDPSGWGDLYNSQKALVQLEIQAKQQALTQKATGEPGSPQLGGPSGSVPKSPGTTIPRPVTPKIGPMNGSAYSAWDLLDMTAAQLKKAAQQGKIPKDAKELKETMDEQVPGILEHIGEELESYFKFLEKEKKSHKITPDDVTTEDKTEQEKKYKKRELPKEKRKDTGRKIIQQKGKKI